MKSRGFIASVVFLIIFSVTLFTRKDKEPEIPYQRNEGTVFGTIYHIIYESEKDLHLEIKDEMKRFDYSLSTFNKKSVISRVNQNDSTVVLDEWFTRVLTKGMEIAAKTDGAFDMTVAPLVNAWGFGFKKSDTVTPATIDSIRAFVGHQRIALKDGKVVKEDPRTMIDASAIAKGYASDVVAEFLEKQGIKNYMVEIGGEVNANGKNHRGDCWRIGINKPIEDNSANPGEIEEVIQLCHGGMATSGNYRNFYYKDGKRYAHTIDPRSGYPVQHSLLSATVIASNCMIADAYATAFMVLGLEKSLKLAEEDKDLAAFFIYEDENGKNAIATTSNFKQYLTNK